MKRDHYLALCVIAVLLGGAAWMASRPAEIAPADLDNVKKLITAEYAKREGTTVEEVSLIRATPTTATGFAKFRIGMLPTMTHTCQVTMSPDNGQMLWSCKP